MSVETRSKEAQSDEYEALSSIYEENFHIIELENRVYSICVVNNQDTDGIEHTITLQFQHVRGYPYNAKLKYQIHAPWLKSVSYRNLIEELDRIIEDNMELPVVHLMIETISSFIQQQLQLMKQHEGEKQPSDNLHASQGLVSRDIETNRSIPTVRFHLNALPHLLPMAIGKVVDIFHGEPIVDRKSVFQAHCARVTTVGQISRFISTMLSDRKVATATHNIVAWRLLVPTGSQSQTVNLLTDCDDDGESQAGSRLLHLLTVANACNVAVMVTRWFGGILLGPDRFKHINSAARQLLDAQGILSPINLSGKKTKRKRKD